jgi:hypothetical protein
LNYRRTNLQAIDVVLAACTIKVLALLSPFSYLASTSSFRRIVFSNRSKAFDCIGSPWTMFPKIFLAGLLLPSPPSTPVYEHLPIPDLEPIRHIPDSMSTEIMSATEVAKCIET